MIILDKNASSKCNNLMTTLSLSEWGIFVVEDHLPISSGWVPHGREVALLFENDADWEHLENRSSALLFYGKATKREAIRICEEYNETLFDVENFDDVSSQVLYQQYLEKLGKNDQLWVSSPTGACSLAPSFPSNATCSENADKTTTLPFLCTNSAPHTSEVDTDFSASPKVSVVSNGTIFTGTRDHLTFRFTGVPYAQPPVGSLRFQYPQTWNGTEVDATALKPGCLQFGTFENNDLGLNPWGISEDCLYLNVFTPYVPSNTSKSTSLKPVLLWIHGGANLNGLGSDATFDGGPFVSRTDTVIVTINYRLNIFGFLSLNDGVITGNYALADKIASLQWVKDNIAAFGGDPENVTIFGQSAGGWSIVDLLRSPPAKGLFSRAISQSGGASTFRTAEAAAAAAGPAIGQVCNSTGVERLECLQSLPPETLLNLTQTVESWPSVQDGVYIIDSAVSQISQGPEAINSVPFLLGFMPDEGQSLIGTNISPNGTDFKASLTVALGADLAERVLDSGLWNVTDEFTPYNATVNAYGINVLTCPAEQMIAAAVNSSAFPSMYVYTMRRAYGLTFYNPYGLCSFPVGQTDPSYYLCHSGDLYEVFGTYHLFKQPVRAPEDIQYTALVQDLWGAFAKSGNPNPDVRYLEARGRAYQDTLQVLTEGGWTWPNYNAGGGVASLNYPALSIDDALPDEKNGRCPFLLAISS
ncbi:putative carboxylesterase from carbohydrate esterase family gh10 [Moniliophthora roreri MCA 2997]|uniref:Carboxylic ester hydrolase n=1 Tax=Moniliophthora roreri (strain MCA 2997) TaxID=1381753 RepID=V2XGC0_MONRO|nr:putative carboxylesterase from carbohydrate esterase family gh10 [Moniliophthora roreri MCA 2997]